METTRRIVMFNRVSADGYFAGADGNLDWVVPDEEVDRDGAEGIPGSDTILLGRRTYEMFEAFWPHALDEPGGASDPHGGGPSPEMRAMAEWINGATKIVFSRTRDEVTWNGSRLLREIDPAEIETMKSQPGKDLLIFGSGSVVSQLTEHRLIDEYRFVVSPTLLGDGRSLLTGLTDDVRLELIETKTYPSGNLGLTYTPT